MAESESQELEPNQELFLTRGTICNSPEEAIGNRLNLYTYGQKTNPYPGQFFSRGEQRTQKAENYAQTWADRKGKSPCVIQLTVTPANFDSLKGHAYGMLHGRLTAGKPKWLPFRNFQELESGQVHFEGVGLVQNVGFVVDLGQLRPEDLERLKCRIGFRNDKDSPFVYKSFKEWAQEFQD